MKNLKLFNYFKVKGNKRVGKWGTWKIQGIESTVSQWIVGSSTN